MRKHALVGGLLLLGIVGTAYVRAQDPSEENRTNTMRPVVRGRMHAAASMKPEASRAAERIIGRSPRWVDMLLTLRNLVVAPFGLHTQGPPDQAHHGVLGLFPVISQTPDRLVAGFDDKHLDFRIVVDVSTTPVRPSIGYWCKSRRTIIRRWSRPPFENSKDL